MARIGIFGGSFDPVHHGHLIMAQDVMERCELQQFIFVPCGAPPHKKSSELADAKHRLAMLEMVAEDDPWFEVSSMELERPGYSYTIDTLEALRREHPGDELCLVIGSDTLAELHGWHRVYDVLKICRPITAIRPGYDMQALDRSSLHLDAPWPARLRADVVQGHLIDIASSDIRVRVAEGMSIHYLVPPAVEMYIYEHGLYRT